MAAGAALTVPAAASASAGESPGCRDIYLDDNTTGTNTIGAFDRHADGSLNPEPGSPFDADGTGAGLASPGSAAGRRRMTIAACRRR